MCALRLLSESIPKVTDKTFSRKFISLGRIVTHWAEIMGADMASKAQPLKIHFRKPKTARSLPQTTLDIAVSSADAVLLTYQKDVILEKINRVFGERWITDIKFVHMPDNRPATRPKPRKTLTDDQKSHLSQLLEGVTDPDIKARLESFGLSMLERENS